MVSMEPPSFIRQFGLSFIIIGILFAVSSIFWTNDVARSKEDLSHMSFGFPLLFFVEDQSQFDPPYPYTMHYCGPWECPRKSFSLIAFAANTLFFGGILGALIFMGFLIFPRAWPFVRFLAPKYVLLALACSIILLITTMLILPLIAGGPIVVIQNAG